jgi:hypothetical protein
LARDDHFPALVIPQVLSVVVLHYEDWHEIELTASDGDRIRFCCYGDFTGSWPERWEFNCSCAQRDPYDQTCYH